MITTRSVAALLDRGDREIARSRYGLQRAGTLQLQASALLVMYRAHRFRAVRGASDIEATDDVRALLRTIAACRPVRIHARHGRGGVCGACGSRTTVGEIQYDVISSTLELRLDARCYQILLDELARVELAD